MSEASYRKKAVYICYMVKRLISAYVGLTDEDDRDHLGKKRVESSGDLMLSLFTYEFKTQYIENAKRLLIKRLTKNKSDFDESSQLIFDNRFITQSLRHSLSTGQWGKTRMGDPLRSGVSQVLKRDTTYFAALSHMRRLAYPMNSSSKTVKIRLLHNTQFGYICPAETPEGQKIGVIKNLSLMTKISAELP
jgi:DNA-directed RNA polymerase II subunit RPB2